MPLQIKRGPTADRTTYTPVQGELVFDTDENKLYVGDGTTVGGIASTSISIEDAQDAAASLLTSGIHTGISFTYNDTAARIDAVLGTDLVTDIKGSVFADDSTILVDSVSAQINLDGTVKGDIVPDVDSAYDLGSASFKFRDLYLSGTSIYLGSALITASGSIVNLPAGSTIGGLDIGSGSGVTPGSNYNINIVGDDSTVILNSSTKTITAAGGFVGNITGNLIGNTTGYHTGDVKGSIFADDSTILVDAVGAVIRADIATDEIKLGTPSSYDLRIYKTVPGEVTFDVSGLLDFRLNATNLNLGSNTYSSRLNIFRSGSVGTIANFYTAVTGGGTSGNNFSFYRANGTLGSPTAMADGERIIDIDFHGHTGSGYFSAANIRAYVDGTPSAGVVPGGLVLMTRSAGGSMQNSVTIDSTNATTLRGNLNVDSGNVNVTVYGNNQSVKSVNFYRARGNISTPTTALANDHLYSLKFNAYDGSAYQQSSLIRAEIDGSLLGGGIVPGKLVLMTVGTAGTMTTAMQINKDQVVSVNKALQLPVYADSTARSAGIPTPATGMVCITASSFTWYDGTVWQTLT